MIQDKELCFIPVRSGATTLGTTATELYYISGGEGYFVHLPPGQWDFIGLIPGMEESEAKQLLPPLGFLIDEQNKTWYIDFTDKEKLNYRLETALESLHSRMEAAGAYLVNPIERLDRYNPKFYTKMAFDLDQYLESEYLWSEAQSRTSSTWAVVMNRGYKNV